MNVLLSIYYVGLLVSVTNSCQESRSFLRDETLFDKKQTEGSLITKLEITNRGNCAIKCSQLDNCISFFYHSGTQECQLNSVVYLSTDGFQTSSGTEYYRQQLECSSNPQTVAHSTPQFDVINLQTTSGTELIYACDSGYVQQGKVICQINGQWSTMICLILCPTPAVANANQVSGVRDSYTEGDRLVFDCIGGYIAINVNNITCQADGTWTSMECNPIQTCRDVRQCNSSYSDGDYWIYPPAYGNKRVKIFCHDLAGTPAEFVSLIYVNKGYFPNLSNQECNGEVSGACRSDSLVGETEYRKIKVTIMSMVVNRTDSTFATTLSGFTQNYGEANDCYSIHYSNAKSDCGPKGTFNINLVGTGLSVDPDLEFYYYGWSRWCEAVRSADSREIDLLCGGWSGGCKPAGDFKLMFDAENAPPDSDATVPHCEYR